MTDDIKELLKKQAETEVALDDLAAIQEDVTEFTVRSSSNNRDIIKAWLDDENDVIFKFDFDYMTLDQLSDFIPKLRQMQATLRRRKPEGGVRCTVRE